jgi:hypothetical protein
VASNHHHSSQTDKPEPTSDALGALAGKNTLMTQGQGQKLKSLAIQGIAESE